MNISSLHDALCGQWKLRRTIDDKRLGRSASMRGVAMFDAVPDRKDCLFYTERSAADWGAYSGESYQNYLYFFRENLIADVFFSDGRFFHTLDLKQDRTRVTHLCGQDRYEGQYVLYNRHKLVIEWTVMGPRKDYISKTEFYKELSC